MNEKQTEIRRDIGWHLKELLEYIIKRRRSFTHLKFLILGALIIFLSGGWNFEINRTETGFNFGTSNPEYAAMIIALIAFISALIANLIHQHQHKIIQSIKQNLINDPTTAQCVKDELSNDDS